MPSPDWRTAYAPSCGQPVLLITSMPGRRVIDAQVHIGCHHLAPLKVHHQLTLAGIEGATCLAGREDLGPPCGSTPMSGLHDRWRHPRYLTKRGNLHIRKRPYPWPPTIPAPPLHDGGVSRNRRFSPCDDLCPKDDVSLVAESNERFTQGPRKRMHHNSHPGRSTGVQPPFSTRLLSIPTSTDGASCMGLAQKTAGVSILVSRRVVLTGRLASRGAVRRACSRQVLPRTCWMPSNGGT
jgi:hypothetical protein